MSEYGRQWERCRDSPELARKLQEATRKEWHEKSHAAIAWIRQQPGGAELVRRAFEAVGYDPEAEVRIDLR